MTEQENNSKSTRPRHSVSLGRLFRILLWVLVVFGSLITFPAGISWMIGLWIGWIGCLVMLKRPAWLPLAILLFVLAIKQTGWTPALIALLVTGCCLLVGIWREWKVNWLHALLAMWIGCFAWFATARWSDANRSHPFRLSPNRPVVCLGDSLTDYGYPQELEKLIRAPIADFGRNGYTTTQAIKKLMPEIEALNPQCVIVELGGHDYKDGRSRAETRAALAEIIERAQAVGAEVILVEIPSGFISDPFAGLERELCREYDLELISDTLIRRFIFFSPNIPPGSWLGASSWLSEDGLHPNDRGNRLFAEYVAAAIK